MRSLLEADVLNTRTPFNIWRAIPTFLFGAIPASFVALMPLTGFLFGILGLFMSRSIADFIGSWLILLWAGAGLYGTLALWAVAISGPSRWSFVGLLCGAIAIGPATVGAVRNISVDSLFYPRMTGEWITEVGLLSVPVVAISWIAFILMTALKEQQALK